MNQTQIPQIIHKAQSFLNLALEQKSQLYLSLAIGTLQQLSELLNPEPNQPIETIPNDTPPEES